MRCNKLAAGSKSMAVEAGPKNGGACYARQGPHFMPFSHGYLFYAEAVLNFVEFKPQHCSRIAEAAFDTSSEFYDWSQVLAKVIRSRVAQLFQSLKQVSAVTELRQQTCCEASRPQNNRDHVRYSCAPKRSRFIPFEVEKCNKAPINCHIHESIQAEEDMASRLLQALGKRAISIREKVQAESKARYSTAALG
jgi:hypothetical protein